MIFVSSWLLLVALELQSPTRIEKVPNPDFGKSENVASLPYLVVHYYRPPTILRRTLSIMLIVLILAGVSVLATRLSAYRGVVVGAFAAACAAAVALVALTVMARPAPGLRMIAVGLAGAAIVGTAAAWISVRWWPNTSFERTRNKQIGQFKSWRARLAAPLLVGA